jgi:hypothetical protein
MSLSHPLKRRKSALLKTYKIVIRIGASRRSTMDVVDWGGEFPRTGPLLVSAEMRKTGEADHLLRMKMWSVYFLQVPGHLVGTLSMRGE